MKNKIDRVFEQDFIRVPRPLIREYGLQAAVMLAEIYSEYTYWRNRLFGRIGFKSWRGIRSKRRLFTLFTYWRY
jgi:hypothetical protein